MTEKQLLTARELMEKYQIPFEVDDFIKKPQPDSPIYIPIPEIPYHLMNEEKAQAAQAALDICMKEGIMSPEQTKKIPGFDDASQIFKDVTGVDVLDVIGKCRELMVGYMDVSPTS